MPSSSTCEYCGSTLRSDQQFCPNCGAANPGYVPEKDPRKKSTKRPETITEKHSMTGDMVLGYLMQDDCDIDYELVEVCPST